MMSRLVVHTGGTTTPLHRAGRTPYSAATRFLTTHRTLTREGPLSTLRQRLGLLLQRQRHILGISQAQLSQISGLSLKYIGEVERGEANVSMDALERLAGSIEWDPFEIPLREQDTLPEGVRTLLLAELAHMQHLVQTAIGWVQTLDSAMIRRAAGATKGPSLPEDTPPRPPLGRPRKPKLPKPEAKPGTSLEVAPAPAPEPRIEQEQPREQNEGSEDLTE